MPWRNKKKKKTISVLKFNKICRVVTPLHWFCLKAVEKNKQIQTVTFTFIIFIRINNLLDKTSLHINKLLLSWVSWNFNKLSLKYRCGLRSNLKLGTQLLGLVKIDQLISRVEAAVLIIPRRNRKGWSPRFSNNTYLRMYLLCTINTRHVFLEYLYSSRSMLFQPLLYS